VIASALRRIRPATSHVFNRRLVRILFQPHWRPSSAALAVTRPSGWERSQVSASLSSNGWRGRNGFGHDELLPSYLAGATAWSATRLLAPKNDLKEPERRSAGGAIAHPFSASCRSLGRGARDGGRKSRYGLAAAK
jgi:hypothetical protein